MEDDYSMIDGIIHNSSKEAEKPVAKSEETKSKKPSVLAKLRQDQAAELSADETELLALTDSTLKKLVGMTDEDYEKLELYPDFDE